MWIKISPSRLHAHVSHCHSESSFVKIVKRNLSGMKCQSFVKMFFSSPRCLERVHIYNFIIPDEYLHDKQPPVIKRKNCTTPQSETKCKFTSAFTENFFFNFAFFFYQQRCVCSRYLALHNSSCRGRRGRQKGVRQSIKTSSEREKI